jgi:hypothetical protein
LTRLPIGYTCDKEVAALLDKVAIMSCMRRGRTLAALLSAVALLGVGVTAAAIAASPDRGATYKGKIVETDGKRVLASQPISFMVDHQGRTVSSFTLSSGYPVYCAPKGIGDAQSTTAKISRGKFRAVLPIYAAHNQRQGSVIVTGTFAQHNRESGNVTTDFTASSRHSCNGTAAYTTKAG